MYRGTELSAWISIACTDLNKFYKTQKITFLPAYYLKSNLDDTSYESFGRLAI